MIQLTESAAEKVRELIVKRPSQTDGLRVEVRQSSPIGFTAKITEYYADTSAHPERLEAEEVGHVAAFLCSPLASGITGTLVHVDKGFHTMAVPSDVDAFLAAKKPQG